MRRRQKHTFMKRILFLFIIFLASCRSVSSVESLMSNVESQEVHDSQLSTFDIQHSTLRDSIIYRERTIHDTVYITKEVYRNQRLSTFDIQHSTKADTVVDVRVEKEIIELPPQRYVPKFYKTSTILFYLSLLVMAVIIFIKLKLK